MFPPYYASHRLPSSPPPPGTPVYSPALSGMGPKLVEQYLHLQVYAWMKDGQSFWIYPSMLRNGDVIAYVWNGYEWRHSIIPVAAVDSLQ